jgi:hypothetical protein
MLFSKNEVSNSCLFKLLFICLSASIVFAYSGGTGQSDNPYQIASVSDWNDLMHTSADWNKNFIMTADVNLQGVSLTPVGNYSTTFTGVFEGNSHIISNVDSNSPTAYNIGLFGYLGLDSQVRNLGVRDVKVNGRVYVGGLAGQNFGTITNCYVAGDVVGSPISSYYVGGLVGYNTGSIISCYAAGDVRGNYSFSDYVGGLVGYNSNNSIITGSYASGTVTGQYDIGGLVGENDGTVTNCYAIGWVIASGYSVGGLVGINDSGTISNCYAIEKVSGDHYVGGLVGGNYGTIANCRATGIIKGNSSTAGLTGQNSGSISYCYSTSLVCYSGMGLVGVNDGGSVTASFWDTQTSGRATSNGGTGKTTAQMQNINTFLNAGWDFVGETANGTDDIWLMRSDINDYPKFYWQPSTGYSGGSGPYLIASKQDILRLSADIENYNKHFILADYIDLSGIKFDSAVIAPMIPSEMYGSNSVGVPFTGTFDGDSYIISNLDINVPGDFVALFGNVGSGGQIRNLGLQNVNIITGNKVAGLVALNYGDIDNCYVKGSIKATANYTHNDAGGLVGLNSGGSIAACYSVASVTGIGGDVGGLMGYNSGDIRNCYSAGAVSGDRYVGGLVGSNSGSIGNCYSIGAVSGRLYPSGLVGYRWSGGTVNNSFWDVNSSGQTGSAGGTGKTTAQMKTLSTFTSAGWDFTTPVWEICDGINYPKLAWQIDDIATVPDVVSMTQADAETAIIAAELVVGTITNSYSDTVPAGEVISQSLVAYTVVAPGTTMDIVISIGPRYSGGFGTAANPYQIAAVSDWNNLMHASVDWNKYFILTADVNLPGISLTPIGNSAIRFTGVFNGNNHIIRNVVINNPTSGSPIGLFGYLGSGCQIHNLGVEDVNITGNNNVGGLVGAAGDSIDNCYSTGAVRGTSNVGGLAGNYYGNISNCYSTSTVSGSNVVGGLAGLNSHGNVANCYSTGAVSGTSNIGGLVGLNSYGNVANCYSTSTVSGTPNVGGLAGNNYGNISNCYSMGVVSGSYCVGGLVGYSYDENGYSITNCYSTGTVIGSSDVGGLVGYQSNSIINNSFWDVNSSGWATSQGGTGKTTTEMKTLSIFTSAGWNFTTPLWKICDGTNYPKLAWQIPLSGDFVCPDGVDIYDLAVFSNHWLLEEWSYDIDGDGIITFIDFALFAENWLKQN